jgi:hypothetical protein
MSEDHIENQIKFTINHDRVLSHYIELKKGDTIEIVFHGIHDRYREEACFYHAILSANHKKGYETVLNHTQATNLINLFECVDLDYDCVNEDYNGYIDLLSRVLSEPSIPYKDIYSEKEK